MCEPVGACAYGSCNCTTIGAGYGKVETGDYDPVDVGLTAPYHFPGLVFLLDVGDLGISQIIGKREVWPWILPIHPQDVLFKCVDEISLYFP